MYYDPKCNKFPYPEDTSTHYLIVKKDDHTVFDENYPYIDKSKSFLFKQKIFRILLYTLVYLVVDIRLGLKVKGKENLKKYKDVINNGIVSVSNHVHLFDFLAITKVVRPHHPYVISWAANIRGENKVGMRFMNCVPIPEDNLKATKVFLKSLNNLLNEDKGWLHIYPEGSMWEFYALIRPFKHGAAHFACSNNKPVLPLAFSYRKPSWIRRHIFKQIACFTLNIGEPIYPDESLNSRDRQLDLTIRTHQAVCHLAGIENNIYEPIYNQSKRIDYYTTEYGKNYKGSK